VAFVACSQFLVECTSSQSGIRLDPWIKLTFPDGVKLMWLLCPHCGSIQAFLGGESGGKEPEIVEDLTSDGSCTFCGKPVGVKPTKEHLRGWLAYRDITKEDQILAIDEEAKLFFESMADQEVE